MVHGKVTKVLEYGVFVRIHNSSLTGLCHVSQISDEFVKDVAGHYEVQQV